MREILAVVLVLSEKDNPERQGIPYYNRQNIMFLSSKQNENLNIF